MTESSTVTEEATQTMDQTEPPSPSQPQTHTNLTRELEPLVADAIYEPSSPSSTDDDLARQILEAVLLISDEPVPLRDLGEAIGRSPVEVEQLCDELVDQYRLENRGFVIRRVAGSYRLQTNPEISPYIEKFLLSGQSRRLSAAALETLAIVAYKQPISRSQLAAIRGVNVDGVMRTLENRNLVCEVAQDHGPGKAVLYGTTTEFLQRLGIDSLDELAPLGQFQPDEETAKALEDALFTTSS